MNKVIAILDEPKSCSECVFGEHMICGAIHNKITDRPPFEKCGKYNIYAYKKDEIRPIWCPLKAIPEKEHGADHYDEYDTGYEHGWNSCIDEISK